jgi:hypothetical protein
MLAVLGLLDGSVMCVAVAAARPDREMHSALQCAQQQPQVQQQQQQQQEVAPGQLSVSCQQQQQQQQHCTEPLALSVLWEASGGAPVFSSPIVIEAQRLVVSAAVNGVVTAFGLHSGQQIWQVQLQQQVFADLLLHPLQGLRPGSSSDSGSSSSSERARSVVLVATQAGHLVGLDSSSGCQVGPDPPHVAVCKA